MTARYGCHRSFLSDKASQCRAISRSPAACHSSSWANCKIIFRSSLILSLNTSVNVALRLLANSEIFFRHFAFRKIADLDGWGPIIQIATMPETSTLARSGVTHHGTDLQAPQWSLDVRTLAPKTNLQPQPTSKLLTIQELRTGQQGFNSIGSRLSVFNIFCQQFSRSSSPNIGTSDIALDREFSNLVMADQVLGWISLPNGLIPNGFLERSPSNKSLSPTSCSESKWTTRVSV